MNFIDSFEENWWSSLWHDPQLGFAWWFSHYLMVGIGFGEKEHRGKVPLFISSYQNVSFQHELPWLPLPFFSWLACSSSGLSTRKSKVALFSLLCTLLFLRKSPCTAHTQRGWYFELCSISLTVEYLHKLFGILLYRFLSLPHWFIYSFDHPFMSAALMYIYVIL